MIKLAIFLSGSGTTAESILKAIQSDQLLGVEIVCVVASKKEAGGIERLAQAGLSRDRIHIISPKSFSSPEEFGKELIKVCKKYEVGLVGQYGWMVKTPANFIEAYKGKIINQHPGPLDPGRPDFGGKGMYGINVHKTRLCFVRKTNHDFWTEATTHFVTSEYDQGEVIGRKRLEILPNDTPDSLQERLLPVEHELQIEVLKKFANGEVTPLTREEPLVHFDEESILEECKKEIITKYSK